MTRHQANIEILNRLKEYVDKYPDMRFGQILFNYTPFKGDHDPFYDESEKSLTYINTVIDESL